MGIVTPLRPVTERYSDGLPFAGEREQYTPEEAVWREWIPAWRTYMRAVGTPDSTADLRVYHLGRLAHDLENTRPDSVTFEQLIEWLADHRWAPNTRRSYRGSFRAFYRWAAATGRVEQNPAALLPPVRVPRAQPRPTPESVYRTALITADERVRRAIQLAGSCGMRRGEICKVAREDVTEVPNGWSLRVAGKGGHVRMVPLPPELARDLLDRPEGWTFPSQRGGHISARWLGKLVRRELPRDLTTHTLRHRCASVSYAATKDIRAVQELLGHASIQTTQLYTATPDDAIRAAMMAAAA